MASAITTASASAQQLRLQNLAQSSSINLISADIDAEV